MANPKAMAIVNKSPADVTVPHLFVAEKQIMVKNAHSDCEESRRWCESRSQSVRTYSGSAANPNKEGSGDKLGKDSLGEWILDGHGVD